MRLGHRDHPVQALAACGANHALQARTRITVSDLNRHSVPALPALHAQNLWAAFRNCDRRNQACGVYQRLGSIERPLRGREFAEAGVAVGRWPSVSSRGRGSADRPIADMPSTATRSRWPHWLCLATPLPAVRSTSTSAYRST